MERWWFVAFAFASMSNLASAIPIDNGVTGNSASSLCSSAHNSQCLSSMLQGSRRFSVFKTPCKCQKSN